MIRTENFTTLMINKKQRKIEMTRVAEFKIITIYLSTVRKIIERNIIDVHFIYYYSQNNYYLKKIRLKYRFNSVLQKLSKMDRVWVYFCRLSYIITLNIIQFQERQGGYKKCNTKYCFYNHTCNIRFYTWFFCIEELNPYKNKTTNERH